MEVIPQDRWWGVGLTKEGGRRFPAMIRGKAAPYVLQLIAGDPDDGNGLAFVRVPEPAWFPGTISLPPRFTMRRTGTIDSDRGEIAGPDGLVIGFDIGYMAGLHMHDRRKAECEWFFEHTIAGQRAFTGVMRADGRRRIVTSTYDQPLTTPANFWADVRDEKDIAAFLAIVSTYKPAPY